MVGVCGFRKLAVARVMAKWCPSVDTDQYCSSSSQAFTMVRCSAVGQRFQTSKITQLQIDLMKSPGTANYFVKTRTL